MRKANPKLKVLMMSAKVVIKQGNRVLTFGTIISVKRLARPSKIENGENAAVASQEGVEMNGESHKRLEAKRGSRREMA